MMLGLRGATVSEEVNRGFSFVHTVEDGAVWNGAGGGVAVKALLSAFIKTCPPGKSRRITSSRTWMQLWLIICWFSHQKHLVKHVRAALALDLNPTSTMQTGGSMV